MKLLLFAGAGTSVELGVPSMAGLATEFLDHTKQWEVEPELVERIMKNNLDLEHLIEELDSICGAETSLKSVGKDTSGLQKAEKARTEVEWFVQHAAERVSPRDAKLMWGAVLQATTQFEITFVTTNYDRAIELAANAEGIRLNDGFGLFADDETVEWVGFGQNEARPVLVKLHGSTDWFADRNANSPTKLRHPMPLFGGSTLRLVERELDSALVLPSRQKMLTGAPYPRLSQAFLNAADCCDLAVFVGSSLRDEHVRDAARSVATRAPAFIVNPDREDHGIQNATVICQYASTFLMSTLPNALLTCIPSNALRDAGCLEVASRRGVLPAVRDLVDTSVEPVRRCRALEALYEIDATLHHSMIERLIDDDDPTVARYALGLVPQSTMKNELTKVAARSRHVNETAFREELEILRILVSS